MSKDERVYLAHIRDSMADILEYTRCSREDYLKDRKTQDAVIRRFEVLGEASKRMTFDTRERYPDIPWGKMAGLRDRAIHDYMDLSVERLWNLAVHEIPRLKSRLDEILKELGEPGEK